MNGAKKLHKVTGPAFAVGEEWVDSTGTRCWITGVRQYAYAVGDVTATHSSDYEVSYSYADGTSSTKDGWMFQVRYQHIADRNL